MTYGQLFMVLNPNVKVIENGTCVWIYFDGVNHDTFRTEWWNKEIPDEALKVQEPGWISVKDRLPEEEGEYLISDNFKVTVGWFSGENGWIGLDGSFYAHGVVTYFMPLPEPPKEGT